MKTSIQARKNIKPDDVTRHHSMKPTSFHHETRSEKGEDKAASLGTMPNGDPPTLVLWGAEE